jgi:hypothetical protein
MKQDQVNQHLAKIKAVEAKLASTNREKDRLMK